MELVVWHGFKTRFCNLESSQNSRFKFNAQIQDSFQDMARQNQMQDSYIHSTSILGWKLMSHKIKPYTHHSKPFSLQKLSKSLQKPPNLHYKVKNQISYKIVCFT